MISPDENSRCQPDYYISATRCFLLSVVTEVWQCDMCHVGAPPLSCHPAIPSWWPETAHLCPHQSSEVLRLLRPLSRQRFLFLTPRRPGSGRGDRRREGSGAEDDRRWGERRGEERRVIHEECLILISSQEHLLTWSYLAWLSFCLISFSIIHHK